MKILEISSPPPSMTFATFLGNPVRAPGDIKDLIGQHLKIEAGTDAEAVQKTIDMLKDRPRTRLSQQIFNDLEMMVRKMRLPIGGYHSAVLRHQNESRKKRGPAIKETQEDQDQ